MRKGLIAGNIGGYTRISNDIIDHVMPLSRASAIQVILVVARMTDGCYQETAPISDADFMNITGINKKATVIRAIQDAIESGCIVRKESGDGNGYVYSMGEDYRVKE